MKNSLLFRNSIKAFIAFLCLFVIFIAKGQVNCIADSVNYATYLGGTGNDWGFSIVRDKFGNSYIAGLTSSDSGIATNNAYQPYYGGGVDDAFLAKFNCAGYLVWATYFGGSDDDEAYSIAIDDSENIYITGLTQSSSGIATSGAHQTKYAGFGGSIWGDAFLAKFDSSGNLTWATYFGGSGDDEGLSLTTDKNNNVYVSGCTSSSSRIATHSAFQTSNKGFYTAFIAKFTPSGSLVWGTYYGGDGDDEGSGIASDKNNNIYIVGEATSKFGIATSGTHQSNLIGKGDAFIAKFNDSGSRLWGTYYGGGNEYGNDITVDDKNDVYITGSTRSDSLIATSGAYQTIGDSINGNAYIAKFDSSGSLLWGTYYGGSDYDMGYSITTDKSNVYVAGETLSDSGIASSGAYQKSRGGKFDGFAAKFSSYGSFEWGTYYGGDNYEGELTIAADTNNNIYITGYTESGVGIATSGAYQTTNGGGQDAFFTKLSTPAILPIKPISVMLYSKDSSCVNIPIYFNDSSKSNCGTINKKLWSFGDGDTSSVQNPYHIYKKPGIYTIKLMVSSYGGCTDSTSKRIHILSLPIIKFFSDSVVCVDTIIAFVDSSANTSKYIWNFGDGTTDSVKSPHHGYTSTGFFNIKLTVVNSSGCADFFIRTIHVDSACKTTNIHLSSNNSFINLYPNPTSTILNIESRINLIQSITIMDATGREVYQRENLKTQNQSISVSNYSSGIYIIKMGCENGTYVSKFLKE